MSILNAMNGRNAGGDHKSLERRTDCLHLVRNEWYKPHGTAQ